MKAKTLTYVRPREVAEGRLSLPAKALKAQALEYVLSSNTDCTLVASLWVSFRTGIKCTSKEQLSRDNQPPRALPHCLASGSP
jgi:hypothetical protein